MPLFENAAPLVVHPHELRPDDQIIALGDVTIPDVALPMWRVDRVNTCPVRGHAYATVVLVGGGFLPPTAPSESIRVTIMARES